MGAGSSTSLQGSMHESFYIRGQENPQYIVRVDSKSIVEQAYVDILKSIGIKRLTIAGVSALNAKFHGELSAFDHIRHAATLSTELSTGEEDVWLCNENMLKLYLASKGYNVYRLFHSKDEFIDFFKSDPDHLPDLKNGDYLLGAIPDSHLESIESYVLVTEGGDPQDSVKEILEKS